MSFESVQGKWSCCNRGALKVSVSVVMFQVKVNVHGGCYRAHLGTSESGLSAYGWSCLWGRGPEGSVAIQILILTRHL